MLSRTLPTRLLQIGPSNTGKVRLLLNTKQLAHDTQYATLSHCWGTSSHVVQLTSNSSGRLQEGISISELGLTFRDAITTAQELSIQFMWIDSLCIFQDSEGDWQLEAPLMSNVYRFAILNIAATSATNHQTGCFRSQDGPSCQPFVVDLGAGKFTPHYTQIWKSLDKQPLMKRAWVLQELLLAPRVLHQLFWECYDLEACQTYFNGIPEYILPRSPRRRAIWDLFRGDEIKSKEQMWMFWNDVVKKYSACLLTFSSDKLAALSGVAKHVERIFGDEYCAGLWRSELAQQLLWICPQREPLPPRPSPYRAPS